MRACRYLTRLFVGFTLTTLVVLVLAMTAPAVSAQVTLRSEISPKSGGTDDLFLFTVTVEGAQTPATPRLSGDNDFETKLLGPRTSISIINGVVNSRISYVYHLTPKREGTLRTPKAEVLVDGKILSADPIDVSIGRAHSGQGKAPSGSQVPDDLIVLRQTATPASVYQGQQVVYALSIYTRVDLSDLAMEDLSTDGFWQETIAENQRTSRQLYNKEYTVVEVTKALFPLRSGPIELPVRKMSAKIPTEPRRDDSLIFDPFNDDFFKQFFQQVELRPVTVTSNDLKVDVKPLPPVPAEFKKFSPSVPIVGETSLKVEYPLNAMNTGETKTLSVEVTSEGNLNPLKTLPIEVPPRFKLYDERPEVRLERHNGKLITRKTFRYSVVPLTPGLARIPAIKLTFFNPQTGQYETATSSDIAFPVRGENLATSVTQDQTVGQTNEDVQTSSSSVPTMAPLPIAPALEYEEQTLVERISSYISVQLAILIFAGICGIGFISLFSAKSSSQTEEKVVSTAGLQQVSTVKELEAFVREVLSTKLSKNAETSSMDELRARVTTSLSDKNLALALRSLLDDIEVYSYGGAPHGAADDILPLKERLAMILMQWRA